MGKIKYLFLNLLSIFLFLSCQHNQGEENNFIEVKGESVKIDNDLISDAVLIHADSSRIYFRHMKTSPMLSKFKISSDSLIKEGDYIRVGNGPNELNTLLVNHYNPYTQILKFYDPSLRKFLSFNLKNDSIYEIENNFQENEEVTIFRFTENMGNEMLVTMIPSSIIESNSIFGLVKDKSTIVQSIEGIGGYSMEEMDISEQLHFAPNCQIFTQPYGEKYLFISNTGQYAEIFSLDGNGIKEKTVLIDNLPQISIDEHGRILNAPDDLKFGFLADVTKENIYMAPYRFTNAELNNGINHNPDYSGFAKGPKFVDEIWEFDWSGNLIQKFKISPMISVFKIDQNKILWGMSENEDYDPTIIKYDLKVD